MLTLPNGNEFDISWLYWTVMLIWYTLTLQNGNVNLVYVDFTER